MLDQLKVSLEFDFGSLPAPQPVNAFRIGRVGQQVQMLVGYIDVTKVADAIERARTTDDKSPEISIVPEGAQRMYMTPDSFVELKDKVDFMHNALTKAGVLPTAGD